jgi:hypothetical protein
MKGAVFIVMFVGALMGCSQRSGETPTEQRSDELGDRFHAATSEWLDLKPSEIRTTTYMAQYLERRVGGIGTKREMVLKELSAMAGEAPPPLVAAFDPADSYFRISYTDPKVGRITLSFALTFGANGTLQEVGCVQTHEYF